MLKRLLTVLLCAVVLISCMVSCDSGSDEVQPDALQVATEKLMDAKYELTRTGKVTGDGTIGLEKDFFEVFFFDGENFQYELDGYEAIFADNVYYYRFGDDKIKMSVGDTFEKIEESIGVKLSQMGISDLGAYESVVTTNNPDGTTTITLTFPKDLNAIGAATLNSLGFGQAMSISIDEESFKETVVIDAEGRYQSIEQFMVISVSLHGQDAEMEVVANCQTKMEFDYSKGKTITAPADAADYVEIPLGE